jgi:hypothetical protein
LARIHNPRRADHAAATQALPRSTAAGGMHRRSL